jgi:hypothetical protein
MYDRLCDNDHAWPDCLEPIAAPDPPCAACGAPTTRVHLPGEKAHGIAPDSIPGGLLIRNGLCHPDGTPRRFDSFRDINRAAQQAGLTPAVEHTPDPKSGSDKAAHTSSWNTGPSPHHDPLPSCLGGKPNRTLDPEEVAAQAAVRVGTGGTSGKMTESEFAIRRAVSVAELHGLSESSSPATISQYLDNVRSR